MSNSSGFVGFGSFMGANVSQMGLNTSKTELTMQSVLHLFNESKV